MNNLCFIVLYENTSFFFFFFGMQVVNHGVSCQLLEKLKLEIEKFFKLPIEEKKKYQIRPGDVQGYGAVIRCKDQKLDWGDRFYMVINPVQRRKPHLLPQFPPSLRSFNFSLLSLPFSITIKLRHSFLSIYFMLCLLIRSRVSS